MTPSQACSALIHDSEGCRLTAYKDSGGVWTIGWGHTGPEVVEGLQWSPVQADAAFHSDLQSAISAVNSLGAQLDQNQFDALVSLTYNIGGPAFKGSTLAALLKSGHKLDAAAEFPKWCHDNGLVVAGLLKRRCRECLLFLG